MRYKIRSKPSAARSLAKLPKVVQERIARKVDSLADNPRPHGSTKLQASKNLYRIRAGDYRIIYEVKDDVLLILVIRIGHRREVYRNL